MVFTVLGITVFIAFMVFLTWWFVSIHMSAVLFGGWGSLREVWYLTLAGLPLLVLVWCWLVNLLTQTLDISISINS